MYNVHAVDIALVYQKAAFLVSWASWWYGGTRRMPRRNIWSLLLLTLCSWPTADVERCDTRRKRIEQSNHWFDVQSRPITKHTNLPTVKAFFPETFLWIVNYCNEWLHLPTLRCMEDSRLFLTDIVHTMLSSNEKTVPWLLSVIIWVMQIISCPYRYRLMNVKI